MKEVLSGDWQASMYEYSKRISMRPQNRDEIDKWLDLCEIEHNKCSRARLVFKAHRDFHGC